MVASVLRVRMLFDKDVSRRRILREMPSASAVHIACHGAAWALGGMLFRLEWAPPTVLHFSRDGLSFQDILKLDLKGVRLVCLSACDTGAVDASLSWDEFEGLRMFSCRPARRRS
jgi:CHAT domain-containing protein